MKIGNGWHDNREWPKETGGYIIIAEFHMSDTEKNTGFIVKDGDIVIDTDFYNAEHNDWEKNPINGIDENGGWKIVAWKSVDDIALPEEYANAVSFSKLLAER